MEWFCLAAKPGLRGTEHGVPIPHSGADSSALCASLLRNPALADVRKLLQLNT